MASRFFKPSRILAVALVVGATVWIASGALAPHAQEHGKSSAEKAAETMPKQKVGFEAVAAAQHNRIVRISGVTQADKRAFAVARGAGTIREIKVTRGGKVNAGDVIALISDEGRQATLAQAQALLEQRRTEYNAQKALIDRGIAPRNQANALQSAVAAAEAAVAAAKTELDKVNVIAPIAGYVDSVPVQVGQAVQANAQIAEVIGPDPMLAVGAVPEKDRVLIKTGQKVDVRFIDGRSTTGTVSFVALAAEKGTRTYRFEAKIPNADAAFADGVTCEIALTLDPITASPVPRSAIVFSDQGALGVRVVDEKNVVQFKQVGLVDDRQGTLWVTGLDGSVRLITVGQDFVKEGETVEAVPAGGLSSRS